MNNYVIKVYRDGAVRTIEIGDSFIAVCFYINGLNCGQFPAADSFEVWNSDILIAKEEL